MHKLANRHDYEQTKRGIDVFDELCFKDLRNTEITIGYVFWVASINSYVIDIFSELKKGETLVSR